MWAARAKHSQGGADAVAAEGNARACHFGVAQEHARVAVCAERSLSHACMHAYVTQDQVNNSNRSRPAARGQAWF